MPYTKKTSSSNEVAIHSKLRDSASKLVGKTIRAVVLKGDTRKSPQNQFFLVFTDGTSYEIWGELRGASDLDPDGLAGARKYLTERAQDVYEVVDRRSIDRRRRRSSDRS